MSILPNVDRAAEQLVAELSEDEVSTLILEHIAEDPARPGADDVKTISEHVSVWALIGNLEAVGGDLCRAADGYQVSLETLRAALAYYSRNRLIILARIYANSGEPWPLTGHP